jgi:hypothetical protein
VCLYAASGDQSGLGGIRVGIAGIEVFMQTPLDFLNTFRVEMRASGIRFAITSGMACVHYGLQQTTKYSDWIVPPDFPAWKPEARAKGIHAAVL